MTDLKTILETIDPHHSPSLKELKRLEHLVELTRKREKETYSKMFTGKLGTYPTQTTSIKTQEELEFERER